MLQCSSKTGIEQKELFVARCHWLPWSGIRENAERFREGFGLNQSPEEFLVQGKASSPFAVVLFHSSPSKRRFQVL